MSTQNRNLKKLLGNPKITFVLGGPASGKGTQCEKLIEEFGYTHISTGDLMRMEMSKGTKEGEEIKKIVAKGDLVPFKLTVEILIKGLIANKSQNYLIDGFPRAVDQAKYFENNVCEVNQVLFFDVPQEIMLERCMKRAETSGRSDDNAETIKTRVQNYFDQSLPVVDFYKCFGKVSHIDATGSIADVYAQSKIAVLPQVMFMLGPKACGKTSVANGMAARTNTQHIDFNHWVATQGLEGQDDETVVSSFISHLAQQHGRRLMLENFPQNEFQAKFFLRNGTSPSHVFSMHCAKDVCQERMIDLGENHPLYVPSSILSKKIKQFHDHAATLMPFLKANTNFIEISTDQELAKACEALYRHTEPCVISIREGKKEGLQAEITNCLSAEHGFVNLDVDHLHSMEVERGTVIGKSILRFVQQDKAVPAEHTVKMLKQIIYCGQHKLNKYILTNFPNQIAQVQRFESRCAKLAAIIYPTGDSAVVDIGQKELALFNIESMFQKQFRLKTMNEWSFQLFNEKLGNKVEFGVIVGESMSGKSETAKCLATNQGYEIIDMGKCTEAVKATLGTEEEPFEGEVPIADVEKQICQTIETSKSSGKKCKFVFDGYTHKEDAAFMTFIEQFGCPEFLLCLTASDKTIKDRWCKKNEAEEVPEDAAEQMKADAAAATARGDALKAHMKQFGARCNMMDMNTSNVASIESLTKELNNRFSPKVVLVNHEKSLPMDSQCANVAIKYNMLYVSAYQTIKKHIQDKTEWGKRLLKSQRPRAVVPAIAIKDEFQEANFSPVHFDLHTVMQLIKETVSGSKTNQKFVLIEGLCNCRKLAAEEDQLELRFMDEFFNIEATIGEVKAVIGMQFTEDPEYIREDQIEWEKFPEAPVAVEKPKPAEGEEEEPPAEDGEEGEKKAPKFKKEDFQWTVSNRKAKNLPQLFQGSKGINTLHEVRQSDGFGANSTDQISKSLDDFCCRLQDSDNQDKYLYQQVIFPTQ